MIFVGVDWAEAHHDVCVMSQDGRVLGRCRVGHTVAGVGELHALVGSHAGDGEQVVAGIEVDRGLLVTALLAAGYQVYAVNPLASSRYRDRHGVAGAKSDRGDAKVLADLVRTDRRNHRQIAARPCRRGEGAGPGPPVRDLVAVTAGQRAALGAAGVLPGRPRGVRRRSGRPRRRRGAVAGARP